MLATYPADTARFLVGVADPFGNPVGHTLRTGLASLYVPWPPGVPRPSWPPPSTASSGSAPSRSLRPRRPWASSTRCGHRALLVADEIQSGLGRTGKLFCFQHDGVRPDIVIVGKAPSGGFYPVSAILADDEVMGVFHPGDHGSTFGGNPLAAAIAQAGLRVLVDVKLIENSATLGEYFLERLRAIQCPLVKEVRGKGLWIGLELVPEAGGARRFCEALKTKGMLCKETHVTTIRFAPPLNVTKAELDWAIERIESVLK